MKRVLVLHGKSQNVTLIRKAMEPVCNETKDCEFAYLNAPALFTKEDVPAAYVHLLPPESEQEAIMKDPIRALRKWWTKNDEATEFYGVEEAMTHLRDYLKEQKEHFDVIVGLSQGAAVASLLSKILEDPSAYDPVPFASVHPPFKSAIFIAGYVPTSPELYSLFKTSPLGQHTKTFQTWGRADKILTEDKFRGLIDACAEETRRVEYHEGGHEIPVKDGWKEFIARVIEADDPRTVERKAQ